MGTISHWCNLVFFINILFIQYILIPEHNGVILVTVDTTSIVLIFLGSQQIVCQMFTFIVYWIALMNIQNLTEI